MAQTTSHALDRAFPREISIERRSIAKIGWRLVPLLTGIYLVASLDRANVSFAALTMNKDLGLSPLVYGWGSGIYFLGSFLMGIPSARLFERWGARRTLAVIAVAWSVVAAAQALIAGGDSFLAMRLLLGIAEAGLFPIVVLYLSAWFPTAYRARVMALFMLANPLSSALGGLAAGPFLLMDGVAGLHGWQWMFLVEALPPLLLAFVLLKFLPDRPSDAAWLAPEERRWLTTQSALASHPGAESRVPVWTILVHPTVVLYAAIYFGRMMSLFGVTFFLPLIFKGLGLSNAMTGYVSAIPFTLAVVGMLVWAHHSDRAADRRRHLALTHIVTAAGLLAAVMLGNTTWSVAAMSVASIGFSAEAGVFWSLPSMTLPPAMVAVAVSWINAVGVIGAIVGPLAIGLIKQETGGYTPGLCLLAVCVGATGLLAFLLPHPRQTPKE